jgi:hypothetical protein
MFQVKKHGCKFYDNDESWVEWWTVKTDENLTNEEILDELGIRSFYRGPGREFGRRPIVHRYKNQIIVLQDGGLDI